MYIRSLWNCTIFSPVSDGFYTPFLCLVLNEVEDTVSVCFYKKQHTEALGLWLLLQYKFNVIIAPRNTEVEKKPQPAAKKQPLSFPHIKLSSLLLSPSYATAKALIIILHSNYLFRLPSLSCLLLPDPPAFEQTVPWSLYIKYFSCPLQNTETNSASFHVFCRRSERFPNITQACLYLPAQSPFELYLARSPFVSKKASRPSSLSLFTPLSPSFENLWHLPWLIAIILLLFFPHLVLLLTVNVQAPILFLCCFYPSDGCWSLDSILSHS